MPTSQRVISVFLIFSVYHVITAKTPSLNEIKNLKNSELDEIFGATMTESPPTNSFPDMPQQPDPIGRYNRVPTGVREVPINHEHALGPQPRVVSANNAEFNQLAAQGANVLATGANAFYRGAATVGEAFGIPSGGYQVPLFSQAASIFG
uniref:Uncharacterized protein n=1 Tax=Caenorhabditis japonica TaxID=281687 RepID=A0A8R1E5F3_CAEJA